MEITGYRLRGAIKETGLELATLHTTFEGSLHFFDGETKPDPEAIMNQITTLERKIARLHTLQGSYNLKVNVDVLEEKKVTLEYAIKAVGGFGRVSKMWREAAKGEKLQSYERRSTQHRDKNQEYAKYALPKAYLLIMAKKAEKFANAYRMAIAAGNLQVIEFDDSVADLFA